MDLGISEKKEIVCAASKGLEKLVLFHWLGEALKCPFLFYYRCL